MRQCCTSAIPPLFRNSPRQMSVRPPTTTIDETKKPLNCAGDSRRSEVRRRAVLLVPLAAAALKPSAILTPMIHMNQGNTRSATVRPFQEL